MRRNVYIATAVAILLYCISANNTPGVVHASPGTSAVTVPAYSNIYLLEKNNLVNHTWTRIGGHRYESTSNDELFHMPGNN